MKRCENCKRPLFPRKLPNGSTENPSAFKRKRFCSRICGGIAAQARKKIAAGRA